MINKYLARLCRLITIVLLFLSPPIAFADSSTTVNISNNGANSQNDVNVQNSTGGTTCINGNCTTTGGNTSQSTVCINGQCTTSSGDIDMQSNNGDDQVHISDTISGNPVTVSPVSTETPVPTVISPFPSVSVSSVPVFTPNPTIAQIRKNIRKQIREQIEMLKQHIKDQDGELSSLIQSLQGFLNGMFK